MSGLELDKRPDVIRMYKYRCGSTYAAVGSPNLLPPKARN